MQAIEAAAGAPLRHFDFYFLFNQISGIAISFDANQHHYENKEISGCMVSEKTHMRISLAGIISFPVLMMGIADGYSQDSGRCQAYRQERNAILKEYRYCFKSPRAIQYFGNGGCANLAIRPFANTRISPQIRALHPKFPTLDNKDFS